MPTWTDVTVHPIRIGAAKPSVSILLPENALTTRIPGHRITLMLPVHIHGDKERVIGSNFGWTHPLANIVSPWNLRKLIYASS